jgi:hypothetical protein
LSEIINYEKHKDEPEEPSTQKVCSVVESEEEKEVEPQPDD